MILWFGQSAIHKHTLQTQRGLTQKQRHSRKQITWTIVPMKNCPVWLRSTRTSSPSTNIDVVLSGAAGASSVTDCWKQSYWSFTGHGYTQRAHTSETKHRTHLSNYPLTTIQPHWLITNFFPLTYCPPTLRPLTNLRFRFWFLKCLRRWLLPLLKAGLYLQAV